MTRRGLLGLLGSATAALAFDPERALWVPGARTISIPKPPVPLVFQSGYAITRYFREIDELGLGDSIRVRFVPAQNRVDLLPATDPSSRPRHAVPVRYPAAVARPAPQT